MNKAATWLLNPIVSGLLSVGSAWLASWLLRTHLLDVPLRLTVAMLPMPFFALFLWAFIRNIRRLDELQRRIQLEALAVAYPLAILFLMTLGLLKIVIPLPVEEHWRHEHLWLYLPFFYYVGLAIARKRYE